MTPREHREFVARLAVMIVGAVVAGVVVGQLLVRAGWGL